MSLLSSSYMIFLPLTVLLWHLLQKPKLIRIRNGLMLAACWYFYAAGNALQLLVLIAMTTLSFFAGLWMNRQDATKRKLILSLAVLINLIILCTFKYYSFFFRVFGVNTTLSFRGAALIAPAGISFYTLEIIAYLVNIYRRIIPGEKDFICYAMYVSFFPTVLSGPIERPEKILPQIKESSPTDPEELYAGLRCIISGVFRKIVIADRLALFTDEVFNNVKSYSCFTFALAALAFSVQIYCDFSGYSEIAIGSARLLGIKLHQNFDLPYFSKSVKDFWRRWHISLSSWFRDYVYIPLGGNRRGTVRTCLNLMIVFAVSGLWHGANYTFIIWGLLHGFYLVVESLLHLDRSADKAGFGRGLFVFFLTAFAWIPFRSNSLTDYGYILHSLLTPNISSFVSELRAISSKGIDRIWFIAISISIILVLAQEWYRKEKRDLLSPCGETNPFCAVCFSMILFSAILLFGMYGPMYSARDFIYYQF